MRTTLTPSQRQLLEAIWLQVLADAYPHLRRRQLKAAA